VKTALVLSGGSIKGSFQAGVIAEVLDQGFVPDAIYGTSVGSLNGAFLAERAGRDKRDGKEPNWPAIGRQLESFWLDNVTASDKIAKKRGVLALVWAIIGKKFDGLVDMSPMQALVKQELDTDNLRASPVQFYACAVDLATGDAVYAPHDGPDALDYVIASTAIPIEMPVKMIGQGAFVDGGVREVAPLRRAVEGQREQGHDRGRIDHQHYCQQALLDASISHASLINHEPCQRRGGADMREKVLGCNVFRLITIAVAGCEYGDFGLVRGYEGGSDGEFTTITTGGSKPTLLASVSYSPLSICVNRLVVSLSGSTPSSAASNSLSVSYWASA